MLAGTNTDMLITPELSKALVQMESGVPCLYITGKAGTGKSTLLRHFVEQTSKNIAVLAPTGVAAINAGGQTIHSFFRLPPRFIEAEDVHRVRKLSALLEKLDAIVIDEVSMVRADMMDAIDRSLRLHLQQNIPFGGMPMIFFGDLFQLPPIVEEDLKPVFQHHYASAYFFSAKVFEEAAIERLELTRVFRQQDSEFIHLLNKVRNGSCDQSDLDRLNQRVVDNEWDYDNPIVLTTTNRDARAINLSKLNMLPGKSYVYKAGVDGKFGTAYPNDVQLTLKQHAQVMMIKNDQNKQWVNGTITHIKDITAHSITVDINGRSQEVPQEHWEKVKYVVDSKTSKVGKEVVGGFTQYPIKLAWAITIHKSQGQTFDKVAIDMGNGAFTHGQLYVALSRCTSLSGVSLIRPLLQSDCIFDPAIVEFEG